MIQGAAPAKAVCIVNPGCREAEEGLLEASNYRVKKSASAAGPDLIFACGGSSLAFILLQTTGKEELDRVEQMGRSFRHGCALVPHALLGDAAVLDAACRLGQRAEGVCFVYLPAGVSVTEHAARLAGAFLAADGEEQAWQRGREGVVQSFEAVNHVLAALPQAAGLADDLRVLGSLQQIAAQRPEHVAGHTGMDLRAAHALAAFFASVPVAAPQPAAEPAFQAL